MWSVKCQLQLDILGGIFDAFHAENNGNVYENMRPHVAKKRGMLAECLLGSCDFCLSPTIKNGLRDLLFNSAEAAAQAYKSHVSDVAPER